jgi:DNA-binding CsgD family transcriptional regulator
MNIQLQAANGNGFSAFMAHLQETKAQLRPAWPGCREAWLKQVPLLHRVLPQNNIPFFLWDLAAAEIVFLCHSNGVAGENKPPALTDAVAFDSLFSGIHPDYKAVALLFYRAAIDSLIQEEAPEQSLFHFNFLYKQKTGGYAQLLQHIVVAEKGENRRPLLLLSFGHDITYLLKEHTANLSIASPGHFFLWCFNFDNHRLEPVSPFTAQETKVLQALSEGRHTREMAAGLYTSPHTIDTHRRNLLRKTGCVDTTALITYLKMVGYAI